MENNNSSIKAWYLILFILGIIEAASAFFGGSFFGIVVFVVALILYSKLAKEDKAMTSGIRLMLIGSGVHIVSFILGILSFIILFINIMTYGDAIPSPLLNILAFPFKLGAFVVIIIGCIFIYKEYSTIK